MFRFASARQAKALYDQDKLAHLADIAVFKSDFVGARARPDTARRLASLERLDAADHDLEALLRLPEGTLGHSYASFMSDNSLSPFVLTDAVPDAVRRRNAFTVRYAATHDLFHVLLGFDTSWPGELGVLGFAVAQRYAAVQDVAAAFAFVVYPFLSGFQVGALLRAWRRGTRLGRQAQHLLSAPLESWFERDLDEVRREVGLEPAAVREAA